MRALRRRKRSRSRGRKGVVRPLEKTVSFLRYAEGAEGEGSVLEQGRGTEMKHVVSSRKGNESGGYHSAGRPVGAWGGDIGMEK